MPKQRIGTLRRSLWSWIAPGREERIGFWLGITLFQRDAGLRMRCLFPFNMPVAALALGWLTSQFADPVIERTAALIVLPILAVYLIALAVPQIVYQLAFSRESDAGGWLFSTAPLAHPEGIARGLCKAVHAVTITPLCIAFGIVAAISWSDPVSAGLHAGLAWLLSWPMALASLGLVIPSFPLTRPLSRGDSLGPIALPLAAFSAAVMPVGALHYYYAGTIWFWVCAAAACAAALPFAGRCADRRMRRLIRQIS
jgi:hypothetical protein